LKTIGCSFTINGEGKGKEECATGCFSKLLMSFGATSGAAIDGSSTAIEAAILA
jgi:hypothetical protein